MTNSQVQPTRIFKDGRFVYIYVFGYDERGKPCVYRAVSEDDAFKIRFKFDENYGDSKIYYLETRDMSTAKSHIKADILKERKNSNISDALQPIYSKHDS